MPFKILKTQNKITFISRQSNTLSLESKMIIRRLNKLDDKLKIVTINKKLEYNVFSIIENSLLLFKQMYHLATSKVVLVDGYCIPVSILVHKQKLVIIQTWHAAGVIKKIGLQTMENKTKWEKSLAKHMNMHKNYSYVISSSNETTRVFTEAFNVKREQILEFGTPMLDYIYDKKNRKKEEILKNNPHIEKPVILYLPTLRKSQNIDLSDIINSFDFDKYDLVVKLHPINKNIELDKKIKKINGVVTEDLISVAAYVITDYSNVAFLAALSDIKVLFYIKDIEQYKESPGLNIDITEEFGEYSSKDIQELLNIIDDDNYNMGNFLKKVEKYISKFDGKATDRICNFILNEIRNTK